MKVIADVSTTSTPWRPWGAWKPSLLFGGGTQGAWYDPSDLSTLFQDSAGTVPVAQDGDTVALMLDKSGNGNHAEQATFSARPTWHSVGGLSWLQFDGVDDILQSPVVNGWSNASTLALAAEKSRVEGGSASAKGLFGLNVESQSSTLQFRTRPNSHIGGVGFWARVGGGAWFSSSFPNGIINAEIPFAVLGVLDGSPSGWNG